MSRNPYAMPPSRQRQQQHPPPSASTHSRQQQQTHQSSSVVHRPPNQQQQQQQQRAQQQQQKTLVYCNKCQRQLSTTIVLYGCGCLICEECSIKEKCPSCNRKVSDRLPVRELLITAASDNGTDPVSAETAANTELSQWMFVKTHPNNAPLNSSEMRRRLILQHEKQRQVTKIVLQQLVRRTGYFQRECAKYRNGVSSTRSQEVQLTQELHKRKEMFDAQTAKVRSLEQQLQDKTAQVDKFRKIYNESPSKLSSPMQRQPSRQSMNPAEVSTDSMPPQVLAGPLDPPRSSRDPRMSSSRTRGGGGYTPSHHHQNPAARPPQPQYQQHPRPHTPMPQQQQQPYPHHHGHDNGHYHGQSVGRTGQHQQPQGNPYDGASVAYSSRQSHGGHSSSHHSSSSRQYPEQRSSSRQQRPQANPYDGHGHSNYANAAQPLSRSSQYGQRQPSHSRSANPYDQPINPLGGLPASHARGASPQQHYRGGNTYAGGGSVAGSMRSRSSNSASGRILTGVDRGSPFAFSGGAQRAGYGRNSY